MAKAKQQKTSTWKSTPVLIWVIIGLLIAIAVIALVGYKYKNVLSASSCSTNDLTLSAGTKEGAAGTIYQHIVLTNKSKNACTIGGFPTAFLYGSDNYALGTAAAAMSQPSPSVISINKDESVYTVLGYPQAGNFDPGVCSEKSTRLEFYIPGATTAMELPLEQEWCPGFSSTAFKVGS